MGVLAAFSVMVLVWFVSDALLAFGVLRVGIFHLRSPNSSTAAGHGGRRLCTALAHMRGDQ